MKPAATLFDRFVSNIKEVAKEASIDTSEEQFDSGLHHDVMLLRN